MTSDDEYIAMEPDEIIRERQLDAIEARPPTCALCLHTLDRCDCDDGTGRHPTNPPEITER